MNALLPNAPGWFLALLNLSLQAILLAGIVWTLSKLIGRWIGPGFRALLWFVVLARVLVPYAPPSPFSLQNLFVDAAPAQAPRPPQHVRVQTGMPLSAAIPDAEAEVEMPEPEAPAKPFPTGLALAVLWGVGAFGSIALLVARCWFIRTRFANSTGNPSPELLETLQECRAAIGLRYPVRASVSNDVAAPALTGLLPARLIVPRDFGTGAFSAEQIRQILLHELAHVRLGHLWLHWLALAARALHWFNPIIHLAALRLRRECELAADAAVLTNATEAERRAYGETILKALSCSTAPATALAMGMAEEAAGLKQRLRALASPPRRAFGPLGIAVVLLVAVCGLTGAASRPKTPFDVLYQSRNRNTVSAPAQFSAELPVQTKVAQIEPLAFKAQTPVELANQLIREGKLDEAKAVLQQAVAENNLNTKGADPLGVSTQLEKIAITAESTNTNPNNAVLKPTTPTNVTRLPGQGPSDETGQANRPSSPATPSRARQRILDKLKSVYLYQFAVPKETEISEVLQNLSKLVKANDPSNLGINLIISNAVDNSAHPAGSSEADRFTVKLEQPLEKVSVQEALDAIITAAKPPAGAPAGGALKYSIEDYAVVFSRRAEEDEKLYTRSFRLDRNSVLNNLKIIGQEAGTPVVETMAIGSEGNSRQMANDDRGIVNAFRAYFKAAGVNFPTNQIAVAPEGAPSQSAKALFYDSRTGVLFVRASLRDLDQIETALHSLNVQPPQVVFRVSMFEIPKEASAKISQGLDSRPILSTNEYLFATRIRTNAPVLAASQQLLKDLEQPFGATNVLAPGSQFLLSEAEASKVRQELSSQPGVKEISAPMVTTLMGRQARISIEDAITIVTPGPTNSVVGKPMSFGTSVDVVPKDATEEALEYSLTVTFTEFLGYEEKTEKPMPRFRVRQESGVLKLAHGGTQLLVLPYPEVRRIPVLGDIPILGKLFQSENTNTATRALILITPTLIDRAGNRVDLKAK